MSLKKEDNFAVLILSYGRASNVRTYSALRKQGYTGKIYLVCSTDDKQLKQYKDGFDDVLVFSKEDYEHSFDHGDNFSIKNVVVYARNAAFDLAKRQGLDFFLVLDDDYTDFLFRVPNVPESRLESLAPKNLDAVFSLFINFLKKAPKVTSIALAQGGDFIRGYENNFFKKGYVPIKRKLMNCFFNRVSSPYPFLGTINEDVNTYVSLAKTGTVFLTHPLLSINQATTQSNEGGLTDFYLETGTYVKSFYTLMFNPSCVKIRMMGESEKRLHHNVLWKNAMPVIIPEKYKKL